MTPSPSPSQRELFAAHVSTRKPAVGQLCRWKDEVSESERSARVPWAAGFSSKQSLSFRAPEGQGQPTAGGGGGAAEDIAGCCCACRHVSLRRPGVRSGPPPKTQSQAVLASGAPRPTLWVTLRVLSHPRPGQETRLTARDHRGWPAACEFGAGAGGALETVGLRSPRRPALRPQVPPVPGAWSAPPHCRPGAGTSPFSQAFPAPMCSSLGSVPRTGRAPWAEREGSQPGESPELWAVTGPNRHPNTTRPTDGGLVPLSLYVGRGDSPLDFEVSHQVRPRGEALGRLQPCMQRVGTSQREAPLGTPTVEHGTPRVRSQSRGAGRQPEHRGGGGADKCGRSGATRVCGGPGGPRRGVE